MIPFSVNTHTHTHTKSTHAHAQTTQHKLSRVQNPLPKLYPIHSNYNRWQYAWSTNRSTTPSASRGGPHRSRACSTLGSTASACVARAPPLPKRAERYLHKAVHAAKSQQVW